jgi:hypothetical protein
MKRACALVRLRKSASAASVLNNPKLWCRTPTLSIPIYDINLTATENGQFSDELDFKFGVREFTLYKRMAALRFTATA